MSPILLAVIIVAAVAVGLILGFLAGAVWATRLIHQHTESLLVAVRKAEE